MSVLASSWVWRYAQAGGTALIVLLAIADHADDDGIAFPSIATLARKARLDERTIQRLVRRLVDTGALRVLEATSGGRRSNTYQLIMDRPEAISTPVANRRPGNPPPVAEPRHRSPGVDATAAPAELCHPNVIQPSFNRRGAALPPPLGVERCPLHLGTWPTTAAPAVRSCSLAVPCDRLGDAPRVVRARTGVRRAAVAQRRHRRGRADQRPVAVRRTAAGPRRGGARSSSASTPPRTPATSACPWRRPWSTATCSTPPSRWSSARRCWDEHRRVARLALRR